MAYSCPDGKTFDDRNEWRKYYISHCIILRRIQSYLLGFSKLETGQVYVFDFLHIQR